MGFEFAGSMAGSAPVVRRMQVGETCYTGQLLMCSHAAANCPGFTWLLDVAAEAHEDEHPVIGICTGVYTTNDAGWNSTYYGDTATVDTSQAAMVANDPIGMTEIEMTVILPYDTLIRGPLWNATYGTAITELVVTSANSAGTDIAATGDTAIDYADDYGVAYCRQGANRGHYRVLKTGDTSTNVVQAPFPYGIAVGDVFVTGPGVPGLTLLQTDGDANFIDAGYTLASEVGFDVYLHEQNLEESDKEYYVFAFCASACTMPAYLEAAS
jgi:hypothetical protein